jgi:hypothetical protein
MSSSALIHDPAPPWTCFSQLNIYKQLVAHAYNPSHSGGRDQGDCGSKPTPAKTNSLGEPISRKKIPSQTRTCGVAQSIGPEFKPQNHKKKKNKKERDTLYRSMTEPGMQVRKTTAL